MEKKNKIFLVEDDHNFGLVLKVYLELNQYSVTWVKDGKNAVNVFNETEFDICILDVMLPNIDGFSIAREIKRKNNNIPLIFLTAKTLKEDELEGYRIGADDYIKKPFDSDVLLLKIKVILKRNKQTFSDKNQGVHFFIGKYLFDYGLRTLSLNEVDKKLSPKEADLLRLLCIYKNSVLPREEALKGIWGNDSYFTTRSMDVYITKLRKQLKSDSSVEIINIHGKGFRLIEN
ncbi:MAG: response regulator transcription factor [Bacteroidales bacterium]|nr:response regulator transcription factor [Bacteroidales bacterium]